ncbi:anti-anti-sigma factor [Streptomyces canus]|uniref:Anti-anti-sigma factor n=1 Tax=Streptomyces canus TaxID=58343 RepID=A0AAW8F421_9ACTN|nr:STAS domain-containing protein [Streptomyces canus]MDQ0904528.1 anti-anti-sigma factor [Streptomyces canus]
MDGDRQGRHSGRLRVSSAVGPGSVLVVASGEVDFETSTWLGDALEDAVTSGSHRIEVDLSKVAFCDCSGLSALLQAHEHARQRNAVLVVHDSLSPLVRRLFEVMEVSPLLMRAA